MPESGGRTSHNLLDTPCGFNFEYELLEPLPVEYHGIHPTHAVRAQVYVCDEKTWRPIGGLAAVSINATTADPRAVSGIVKTGADAPWPYENSSVRLGMNFPIAIVPGLEIVVRATVTTIIDANEMVACWLVEPEGHTVIGSRQHTIQFGRGQVTTVECSGLIGQTA